MNILIIGNGGREHALAWKINQSDLCKQLYVAPGNAGTAACAQNIDIKATDFDALAKFCLSNKIDIILVGPEEPLVKGIYDFFTTNPETAHIYVIGPSQEAAQLEGSKAFAKAFMDRNKIPTAAYREFDNTNYEEGVEYVRNHALPIVLKADGLAAGKGVLICHNHIEALAEFELMIQQSKFGDAGRRVVVEEFLHGIEMSVFVVTDGINYVLLPDAKDYKRIGVGDTGLNTGGMGAVSPVPFADAAFKDKIIQRIVEPTIAGLKNEKLEYKGFIFIGIIKVDDDPYVIEYNCRLGDPETEVVVPRIESDFVEILTAIAEKRVNELNIAISKDAAATVVAVSGGYPNQYEVGKVISGLEVTSFKDTVIFQSGTKISGNDIVTNGGRVLAVTSFGDNISEAVEQSVYMLEQIYFDEIYFREDIGYEFKK
ncbi:phosphoribosylamine--glycine ligase [Ferruginibacter lapsinanis]|uniref:phosphoribosylamine--glycine ligase n=1 Tax=Ferruginibacter lapsinanis TaxID=563172 RepID=UPI001E44BAC8|nr:phosphoribosylamine--glycine ligase [Ferruginibacter lapsinanis]UEG50482.1 phosphoribosylamine--glycine ligase [Ferruginibacter lapsinanis]